MLLLTLKITFSKNKPREIFVFFQKEILVIVVNLIKHF